jgi:hypothetical protein
MNPLKERWQAARSVYCMLDAQPWLVRMRYAVRTFIRRP